MGIHMSKSPMQIMGEVSPGGSRTYMEFRKSTMDNPELQALSLKTKLLIGIGVAGALQSPTCAMMWTRQARAAGANDAEIAEAFLVARLMKAATVNDVAAEPLAWLASNPATAAIKPTSSDVAALSSAPQTPCCGSTDASESLPKKSGCC